MNGIETYLSNISFLTFIAVFIAGVITSFTPCVYPLIPIVVGVIGSSKESSKARNFALSMAYVLGMAVTFSVLGVAAAVTGSLFGQIQSNPVSNILVGAIIIIFALSMLDVIPLPVFLLSRLGAGKITKKAGVLPAFAMGVASGFVAAPCTTAVIGALLAFVATTQNIALGFSLLFTFALGIGVLLVIVGTFTGFLNSFKVSPVWVVLSGKIMAFVLMIAGCYFIYKAGTLS